MRKLTLAVLVAVSGTAFAQGSGMKPGLWEVKQISQVVDGRDMTAQMAAAQAQMQQSMARMSPEQRKQMEAMMGGKGIPASGSGAGTRICISPAMAARDKPMIHHDARCAPAKVSRSGNKTSFEINCTTDGRTMVGKGESTVGSDLVHTRMDMTTTDASGRHTMKSESQMKYLGPDCQGIKPLEPPAGGASGAAR